MPFNWIGGEVSDYLDPYDAFLSQKLVLGEPTFVCEIGVYKGGWLVNFLTNFKDVSILAIDPYPNLQDVKEIFLRMVENLDLTSRVQLIAQYDDKRNNDKFDVIHIDGEHSERAVLNDLNFALQNLATGGVIIVDDVWHPLFPGIISGVMKIVHSTELVPFLSTRNKMWLCKTSDYDLHFENSLNVLRRAGISFNIGVHSGDSIVSTNETHSYDIENAVKGHTQIQVERVSRWDQLLILGLAQTPKFVRLKRLMTQIFPPVVTKILKKLRP